MSRYFFDHHDGRFERDETGLDLPDLAAVRRAALQALPRITAADVCDTEDRKLFTVVVRDDEGHAIYSANLPYVGLWLKR